MKKYLPLEPPNIREVKDSDLESMANYIVSLKTPPRIGPSFLMRQMSVSMEDANRILEHGASREGGQELFNRVAGTGQYQVLSYVAPTPPSSDDE